MQKQIVESGLRLLGHVPNRKRLITRKRIGHRCTISSAFIQGHHADNRYRRILRGTCTVFLRIMNPSLQAVAVKRASPSYIERKHSPSNATET
jgi:hypothetical protein